MMVSVKKFITEEEEKDEENYKVVMDIYLKAIANAHVKFLEMLVVIVKYFFFNFIIIGEVPPLVHTIMRYYFLVF